MMGEVVNGELFPYSEVLNTVLLVIRCKIGPRGCSEVRKFELF